MPIDLTEFERGAPFSGDPAEALAALQDRLARLQLSQIVHRKRAIILFEGWMGAGKKAVLKRLVGSLDPTHVRVVKVGGSDEADDDRHWLARFWSRLPAAGDMTIFYRSWYRLIVEQRVLGDLDDKRWARAIDEINEFEAQQRDYGTLLVKLYFHATDKVLDERIAARAADPWGHHMLGPVELRTVDGREAYRQALAQMFKQNDTRWAPWVGVDANDEQGGVISALTIIADALDAALPKEPPERVEPASRFTPAAARLSPA